MRDKLLTVDTSDLQILYVWLSQIGIRFCRRSGACHVIHQGREHPVSAEEYDRLVGELRSADGQ